MSADDYRDESVLLLDDALIEQQRGIRREVQAGRKSGVLMEPDRDKPWEYCGPGMTRRIHLYGTGVAQRRPRRSAGQGENPLPAERRPSVQLPLAVAPGCYPARPILRARRSISRCLPRRRQISIASSKRRSRSNTRAMPASSPRAA